jgi:pyruvate dehydrogenase kinase 2/3/4
MCERAYGFAPQVVFLGSNLNLSFPYVDSHLYYVLFELLKNSLRATVEFQVRSPCVRARVCWREFGV